MKVTALVGSPRKKGNTDLLIDKILEGANQVGATTSKLYLYDLTILPCADCRKCYKTLECAENDDMQKVYEELESSDVIVFGTPLYWNTMTAKMKLLVDRLRPYTLNNKLKGKKAVLVVPSDEGEEACGDLIKLFASIINTLGMQFVNILCVKAHEKGEVKNQPQSLEKAYKIGESITK
ncbi:MAG: flavodoxin family protein [Candidatus Freyarchaeota archaeon]|nr:flavodoxin family protein [Candidatus Jordarchaeia archaeon]MBS7268679.1 flavodoxin family protein [Candidatus Jordarchaeia archaeon]MBS7281279.1 flavodoxin family protein [Candidatus Jordarchaeia archaeon]